MATMKLALLAIVAGIFITPTVAIPTTVEAQVLAGRNAARADRTPRVTREQRLSNLLYEAEDRLLEIEERMAEIQSAIDAAGQPTPAQARQLDQLTKRQAREKAEIERLNAALNP